MTHRPIIALFTLAGLCLLLSACAAKPAQTAMTPSPTPAALVRPTSTPTLPPTAAPSPSPTGTPAPTEAAVQWLVPARELTGLPAKVYSSDWEDDHRLRLEGDFDGKEGALYDLSASGAILPQPLPTSFHNAGHNQSLLSPKGTYIVLCPEAEGPMGEPKEQTMQLYRVKDNALISETEQTIINCVFSVRWAPDESAISFVSPSSRMDESHTPFDIYVWKTDGSKPYVIGRGSFSDEPGAWSPDSKRLVLESLNPPPNDFIDVDTFQLLYPDGRQSRYLKAEVSVRAQHGLEWLSNDIVLKTSSCCATCLFHDYYVADTGKHLEDLSWLDCSPVTLRAERPMLSRDQRWYVVEQTNQFSVDSLQPYDFTYTLYDLRTRRAYTLSKSTDVFLEFVGWDASSSTFYLIRRPMNDVIPEKPGEPFGLLALDPKTREMRLVNGEIRYATLGPDRQHFFASTRDSTGLSAAIFDLEGKALSPSIRLPRIKPNLPSNIPNGVPLTDVPGDAGQIQYAWSNDGQRVAVSGGGAIWLLGLDSAPQKLVEFHSVPGTISENKVHLSTGDWSSGSSGLLWSPNDDYLIISTDTQVWVVP